MTAYEQRSYPGNAADTVLAADITAGASAFSVTPGTGTGYPDGSTGPFIVIIDYDNSKAEKIRCSGRVNDAFTVAGTGGGRGFDSTTAQAHSGPAKVRAVWTATDAQEANRAAAQTIGKVTTKGDVLTGTGANTLGRTAAGGDGTVLIFDSTQTAGVRAGANPTLSGASLGGTTTLPNGGLIDSAGRVLGVQPWVRVTSNGQSVASGVTATISWATLDAGSSAMWTNANPTRLIAPVTGKYEFKAALWTTNQNDPGKTNTRIRYVWRVNGATLYCESSVYCPAYNGACPAGTPHASLALSATDYVELQATPLDSTADFNPGDFTHIWASMTLVSG